jgi:hypothetical protein
MPVIDLAIRVPQLWPKERILEVVIGQVPKRVAAENDLEVGAVLIGQRCLISRSVRLDHDRLRTVGLLLLGVSLADHPDRKDDAHRNSLSPTGGEDGQSETVHVARVVTACLQMESDRSWGKSVTSRSPWGQAVFARRG